MENLINCLDKNKAAGIDTIPPKLTKIASDFLTPPLTVAINKSIEENIFPDSAKIASVIPLDKGKPNKTQISNYTPVSVLNFSFSKFYEKAIKKQLVGFMEEYFSPLISANRTNYSSNTCYYSITRRMKKEIRWQFRSRCCIN